MERSDGWLWSHCLLGGSRLDYSFGIYRTDIGQVTPHCSDRAVFGMGPYHWHCFLTDVFWHISERWSSLKEATKQAVDGAAPGTFTTAPLLWQTLPADPAAVQSRVFCPSFQLLTKWTYWRTGIRTLQGNVFPKRAAFLLGAICC